MKRMGALVLAGLLACSKAEAAGFFDLPNAVTGTKLAAGSSFTGPARQVSTNLIIGQFYNCGVYTDNAYTTIEIDASLDGSSWSVLYSYAPGSLTPFILPAMAAGKAYYRCKVSNPATKPDSSANTDQTLLIVRDGFVGDVITARALQ